MRIELRDESSQLAKHPLRFFGAARAALRMRPKRVAGGPVLAHETSIDQLPQIQCWPDDGGAFVTLPQVYTEDAERPGAGHSNLGMYRIQ